MNKHSLEMGERDRERERGRERERERERERGGGDNRQWWVCRTHKLCTSLNAHFHFLVNNIYYGLTYCPVVQSKAPPYALYLYTQQTGKASITFCNERHVSQHNHTLPNLRVECAVTNPTLFHCPDEQNFLLNLPRSSVCIEDGLDAVDEGTA